MYGKKLTWEKSDKYIVLYHHDEHRTGDKFTDLVRIEDSGTIMELIDSSPISEDGYNILPRRTYRRSGLSRSILPLDSFPQWFSWFREKELNEDYELKIQVEDEDVIAIISSMEV